MKIGITYDLRSDYLQMGYSEEETAEFDKEDTIESIESALQKAGYDTDRIGHAKALMKRLLHGDKWDMVFNICEGLYGDGRESLVPAILDDYKIPYVFSGPATLAVTLNKYMAKRLVRDAGIPTPDFRLIRNLEELKNGYPPFPLFIKPVSEGTGKGINDKSIVSDHAGLLAGCADLLERYKQPVLVEEYLPGREFTVGVVGNGQQARVIGAIEILFKENDNAIYSYENKENWVGVLSYKKVSGDILKACGHIALAVWDVTGSNDAGRIDLKIGRDGNLQFIEINPLAGIHPTHSDLPILAREYGIEYQTLIEQIMHAARERHNLL